jgi:hypothetical protein
MSVAALITWVLTAVLGLYMFTTWLIEDDGSTARPSYRRLRAPVMFSHAGLALSGLVAWLLYVYIDSLHLAWAALIILVAVTALGVIMFTRWIPVHRLDAERAGAPAGRVSHRAGSAQEARVPGGRVPGGLAAPLPAERTFPALIVVLHGAGAVVTIGLVLLVALGLGR